LLEGVVDEAAWKALLATLQVYGELHPVSTDALDAYERETGFQLPASYRGFCRVFGPGDVGDWYNVAVPGFEGKPKNRNRYDLVAKTETYRYGREWAEYAADPEQFERAIIFGDDCTGAVFFWDPAEITVPDAHERAIYAVWRDWTQERVSDTFGDFVKICLHRGDRTLYDDPPRLGFRAAWFGRSTRTGARGPGVRPPGGG
jgi:hypothetical protein